MHSSKTLFILTAICFPFFALANLRTPVQTKIAFFSTTLDIEYDPSMLQKNKHCTSTPCIKRFYKKLDGSNYPVLLDNLLAHKKEMDLNDWLFYILIKKSIEHIYAEQSSMYQTSATWFMMVKAGYDVRLYTSKSKYTFLYVRTEDKVFEVPFVKMKDQIYVNLTSTYFGLDTRGILFEIPRFQPGMLNHKPFSFKLGRFPDFPPKIVNKDYTFKMADEEIHLNVDVDTVGMTLVKNFPITNPINYINVPLSSTTLNSLVSALKPHLEGKTPAEQMSTLVSFTRKAFPFKNDQVRFKKDKPLTADQLMLADSSDFEDRCALFYTLLKETTDLNFIVVKYIHDDIITIGVELPEVVGKPFWYKGIAYTICDPTTPKNSSKLGLYPISLDKDIEILEVFDREE